MNLPVEKGPGSQHHGAGTNLNAVAGYDAGYTPAFNSNVINGLLKDGKAGLILNRFANRLTIKHPVSLRPCGAHSGPFSRVQDAKLDACPVSRFSHHPVKGVNFPDDVAFPNAADRRITGHLADSFDRMGNEQRLRTGAGGRQRGLRSSVSATNYDDVEIFGILHDRHLIE